MRGIEMKKKLSVSFSGGRTSAYMAKWLLDNKTDEYDLSFIFANTGLEHEKTLEFVNECDKRWGLNLVWVEAVINSTPNKGTKHKIVSYETACRDKRIFNDLCHAYGLPGPGGYTHCNRELKLHAMKSYYKSIGWQDYFTSIGIRADEIDRINKDMDKHKLIYPLISWKYMTKPDIRFWWKEQDFDLEIPEHYGNCKTCWKKSERKLLTIAKEKPEWFVDFSEMERDHCKKGANATNNDHGRRFFFKNYMTCGDVIVKSKEPFIEFKDHMPEVHINFIDELDQSLGGCSESCEVYSD